MCTSLAIRTQNRKLVDRQYPFTCDSSIVHWIYIYIYIYRRCLYVCLFVCLPVFVCVCVFAPACVCARTRVCILYNLSVVMAMAMLNIRHGIVGVAPHPVPCTSLNVENPSASKTVKVKFAFQKKPSTLSSDSSGFFCIKCRTRICCRNACSLGSLSDQSAPLCSVIDTMKCRDMDLLSLSESCWPGSGVTNIRGNTIPYSGTLSSHNRGVAILLHQLVSECTL